MYLPALAKDLYKAQQEVERLTALVGQTAEVGEQQKIKEQLRQATAEWKQLKEILEGRKEQSKASLYKTKNRFGL